MRVHYIAPSVLPSRAANAVHVVLQCDALAQEGASVTLYACRAEGGGEAALPDLLRRTYGAALSGVDLATCPYAGGRAVSLRIALKTLGLAFRRGRRGEEVLLSRNLYASFLLGVLAARPLLFETHQLETGWRKKLQKLIMTRPWVQTVVISRQLALCLEAHHGAVPSHTLVLHDAAPLGPDPLPLVARRAALTAKYPETQGHWLAVCGYFGHLYAGRGIEVIEGMAAARPDSLFLVFGGNSSDIEMRCQANRLANLRFMGYVSRTEAGEIMRTVDALLMPYQDKVSIGVAGHDTARWMSPMKMFEYMAAGVPILSSDLPVLREVLRDGENALLAPSADVSAWCKALDRLTENRDMAQTLAQTAYKEFKERYTWTGRARQLLAAARGA